MINKKANYSNIVNTLAKEVYDGAYSVDSTFNKI